MPANPADRGARRSNARPTPTAPVVMIARLLVESGLDLGRPDQLLEQRANAALDVVADRADLVEWLARGSVSSQSR